MSQSRESSTESPDLALSLGSFLTTPLFIFVLVLEYGKFFSFYSHSLFYFQALYWALLFPTMNIIFPLC